MQREDEPRDNEIQEGCEIISKDVSTTQAYMFFQQLEESGQFYKAPEA